jgi:hypothetical protein
MSPQVNALVAYSSLLSLCLTRKLDVVMDLRGTPGMISDNGTDLTWDEGNEQRERGPFIVNSAFRA